MCLNPRKIRNPTSYISAHGGQPLEMYVKCNHCAECKQAKRLEYRFRSFHQVNECVNHGGYVYFDTLTYKNKCLPTIFKALGKKFCKKHGIDNFSCFRVEDWRNFLKNLRRQLDYHYPGANFKYFITSEYGLDERYTHRPHYHILFFVNNSKYISPYEFSALVSKCWKCGRTDGLPYKSRTYVKDHVFGYDLGQKCPYDFLKASNYVSKYITKDSTFQSEIDIRIDKLKKAIHDDDLLKQHIRNIDMFHRQSQGFGLDFIKNLNDSELNKLIDTGVVTFVDSEKVVATLPLPEYYKRKLFYTLKRDDEGKYYWIPSELGLHNITKSLKRNTENVAKRYYTTYLNASDFEKQLIAKYLNNRTFYEFANYLTYYRGRCFGTHRNLNQLNNISFDIWINDILNSYYVREHSYTDLVFRDTDTDVVRLPLTYTLFNEFNYTDINYDTFIKQHTYDEHSCPHFRNFDKLYALFQSIENKSKKQKQITFDFVEELEKKFKYLYNYV